MKIAHFHKGNSEGWGIVQDNIVYTLIGDLYGDFEKGDELCSLQDIRLLAPAEPSITVACGMNYMERAKEITKEMGLAISDEPRLFFKPANTVIGFEDDIVYPALTQDLRCEGELCIVIKKETKNIPEETAQDFILGYTCGNELTAFDIFQKDQRLTRAKSFDTFGPLGPYLVTGLDPRNLAIKSRVNGETKQEGNTRFMIFGVEKLVSYISAFMTLHPGDVIWTGTPKGGNCPVSVGDVIEVEIEGIGILRNKVVAPT